MSGGFVPAGCDFLVLLLPMTVFLETTNFKVDAHFFDVFVQLVQGSRVPVLVCYNLLIGD